MNVFCDQHSYRRLEVGQLVATPLQLQVHAIGHEHDSSFDCVLKSPSSSSAFDACGLSYYRRLDMIANPGDHPSSILVLCARCHGSSRTGQSKKLIKRAQARSRFLLFPLV